jgi:hypothetical protein
MKWPSALPSFQALLKQDVESSVETELVTWTENQKQSQPAYVNTISLALPSAAVSSTASEPLPLGQVPVLYQPPRAMRREVSVIPAAANLPKPTQVGRIIWQDAVLLLPPADKGDQPLTLKIPQVPEPVPTVEINWERFKVYAKQRGLVFDDEDMEDVARELGTRCLVLRCEEFKPRIWRHLKKGVTSGYSKQFVALMTLALFVTADNEPNMDTAVALIYCISRIGVDKIRENLKAISNGTWRKFRN